MSVSQNDIAQLQQQIAELTAVVSSKQDAQLMSDQNGNVLGVKDCLALLEGKMKAVETRVDMTISELHVKAKNTEQRLDNIDAKLTDHVSKLDQKIDAQSMMMRDMHNILSGMVTQQNSDPATSGETAQERSLRPPQSSPTTPVFHVHRAANDFDYKKNAKVVIFGVAEPEANTTTESDDGTRARPTIRSQVEQTLKDAGARYDTATIRSTKRLGIYRTDGSTQAKPRPICIQFSQPDIASSFLREN
ncbi:hypothetical protein FOZ63_013247, partial [Perkinsus olseni]